MGKDISVQYPVISRVQGVQNEHEDTVKYPLVTIPETKGVQSEPYKKTVLPLSGKLVTAEDPLIIGKNFRTLTNMRYGDESPRGIGGMTKINATYDLDTYLKVRNAHHFRKLQPAETTVIENHILAQAWNAGLTASTVVQNVAAPPAVGEFVGSGGSTPATALWTDASVAGVGRFSEAPGGKIAYCNGIETCLWGGNGIPCTSFITSTADVTDTPTNPRDYSDAMLNTKTDSENVAIIGGGIDSYTVLNIHANEPAGTAGTSILDSSLSPKTITCYGNACINVNAAYQGTGSIYCDGAGDFIAIADSDDWYMDGAFDIEIPIMFGIDPHTTDHGIFQQYQDANNYVSFSIQSGVLLFVIMSGGSRTDVLSKDFGTTLVPFAWYQFNIKRGWGGAADDWALCVNGTAIKVETHATTYPNLSAELEIGNSLGIYLAGWIGGDTRISKGTARATATFTPSVRPYSAVARYWLVRTPLPIQGGKIYVPAGKGNRTPSSYLTLKEWDGSSWANLTTQAGFADNTNVGNITLYQTGTFTCRSTVATSKQKFIEGGLGFWYLFSVNNGDAEIYHITFDCPFQQIQDIPDGIDRPIAAFFKYTTLYTDYTLNVLEDYYDTGDDTSYADLSSLGAFNPTTGANCVIMGFIEPQAAFNIGIPSDKVNAVAGTLGIDYWNGAGFVSVAHTADGTFEGTVPLAKPGTISYTIPDPWNVFKRTLANNSMPLYYYRLRSSGAFSAGTAIYYVSGTAAPKQIRGYKFPLYSQDCLMLCCNMDAKRNSILVSAPFTSQVFNGDNSTEIELGDQEEINAGCSVFSQYGSNLFNITMLFKDKEIWNLVRTENKWTQYRVSETIGCPSGLTLDTVIIPPIEGQQNANRCLAIWAGADGVYISEGRHPTCVSYDIRDLWDQTAAVHINQSYMKSFTGFVDKAKLEYHLFVALTTGTVTTLDAEYVLDLRRWKWFKVDRGTGKKLQCGISVIDAYGANHSYGFIDTGYMERLENGTTFDGGDIVSTFHTGDFPLIDKDLFVENEVKAIVPILVAKADVMAANATLTLYTDTYTTGTDYTIYSTNPDHRLAFSVKISNSVPGVLHSLKMAITTNAETCGIEPLLIGIYYQEIRQHDYS